MRGLWHTSRGLLRDTRGNIAISAALTFPVVIGALALGIDYGNLTLQKRALQQTADLSAIAASSAMNKPEEAVLSYFQMNGQNLAVRTETGAMTPEGEIPFDPEKIFESRDGYAMLVKGRYVPDPEKPVDQRFQPGAQPYDAVKVTVVRKSDLFFAGSFATPPELRATGTAASNKVAAFSVGSRLASLDGGILNALLGKLLGTTVSLKVMDYRALVDTQVNLLHVLDALAIDLGLTAGTYSDVLATEITYGKLLDALGKTTGVTPAVDTVLNTLENALGRTQVKLKLEEILALGPLSENLVGQGDGLMVKASLMDIISAAAVAGNNGKQLAIDLRATIPGLASITLDLAIGEPPVGTPPTAVGEPGTVVRTAQTRLALRVAVDGLAAIAGLKVEVPLYLEVAHAEARLADIRCGAGSPGTVDVEVVPGVASLGLGKVDPTAFENFGTKPRVTEAKILSSLLINITGKADIAAGNLTKKTLTFSPADIAAARVQSVPTTDTLTSLLTSAIRRLRLEIQVGPLALGTPTLIQNALADTLSLLTKPLDTVLYNLLVTLGVRIGEADVRVTGVSCQRPVLVQ